MFGVCEEGLANSAGGVLWFRVWWTCVDLRCRASCRVSGVRLACTTLISIRVSVAFFTMRGLIMASAKSCQVCSSCSNSHVTPSSIAMPPL